MLKSLKQTKKYEIAMSTYIELRINSLFHFVYKNQSYLTNFLIYVRYICIYRWNKLYSFYLQRMQWPFFGAGSARCFLQWPAWQRRTPRTLWGSRWAEIIIKNSNMSWYDYSNLDKSLTCQNTYKYQNCIVYCGLIT